VRPLAVAAGLKAVRAVLLAAATTAAAAQTAVLHAVADSTLVEEPTGALANGAGTRLFAGRVGNNAGQTLRRALVRFDLSSLPPTAQINSVSLTLTMDRSRQAGDLPVAVHRVTQSWNEGPTGSPLGNGDPAVAGDTTWIERRRPDLRWAQAGGDFVAMASATREVGTTVGPYTWASTPQLTADVQSWRTQPAQNHGWILLGFEGSLTSAKGFVSRESSAVEARPTLTVNYTVPPPATEADVPLPPWALAALGLGLAAAMARRQGRRQGAE